MADKNIREQLDNAKVEMLDNVSKELYILTYLKDYVASLNDQGIDIAIYKYDVKDEEPNFENIENIVKNNALVSNLYLEIMGHKFPLYIVDAIEKDIHFGMAKTHSNEYKAVGNFDWYTTKDINLVEDEIIKRIARIEVIDGMFKAKNEMGSKLNKNNKLKIENLHKRELKKGRSNDR